MSSLQKIVDVDIDPDGVFKYILIDVTSKKSEKKTIVRGYKDCAYHADILDHVIEKELRPNDLSGVCPGGGRIQHDASAKKIKVYGYSQGFGKADHKIAVKLLKQVFKDYDISYSDEGY